VNVMRIWEESSTRLQQCTYRSVII